MKFNGKELFELGVPPQKIKFVVNKEFSSVEEMFKSLEQNSPKKKINDEGTWFKWILDTFPHLPMEVHGDDKNGVPVKMSKSKLRRYMDQGAIIINGKKPNSQDKKNVVDVESVTWFPNSESKRTSW